LITAFALVRPDGCRIGCFHDDFGCACFSGTPTPRIEDGIEVFPAQDFNRGRVIVEVRRGANGRLPGSLLEVPAPDRSTIRPSLQIESNRPLGDGSEAVCDVATGGGVRPVPTPSFAEEQWITEALNDFACRFRGPINRREDGCAKSPNGEEGDFLGVGTLFQFCFDAAGREAFPPGETLLTVRVLDTSGTPGPTAQIKVFVPTPIP